MEIVDNQVVTLLDYSKQFTEAGEELAVIDVIAKNNPMIADAMVTESNSDAGHQYAVLTGIPDGTWRRAYKGVQPAKGTQKVVTESFGTLAAYSTVDKLIAEKGGKVSQVRARNAKSILSGLSNMMGKKMVYGSDKADEEAFTGFEARYNKIGTFDSEDSSRCVVSAGGSTDKKLSSILLVTWDSDKAFTFFPKGTKAGVERIDSGLTNVEDGNGKKFPAYEEYFEWKMGLAVADWRYCGRVCNIASDTDGAALLKALNELCNRVESNGSGKTYLYMNKSVRFMLEQALEKKGNVFYTPQQPGQPLVMTYRGIPVHVCDFITNTEALVK